jgi:Zn-dependent metalloprotease
MTNEPSTSQEQPQLKHPQRSICSAQNLSQLPGVLVRSEGSPPVDDMDVNNVYDHLGIVIRFYQKVFARNSIDGKGQDLLATVHYEKEFSNAFWNGTQLVFGDGDGKVFARFTEAVDVTAIELAKGVVQSEVGLQYISQSGALVTSITDVFGALTKQYALRQTVEQADWLIGAGLLKKGLALRSMKSPGTAYDDPILGKDPQPGHMRNYVKTSHDNGGVHINSGIPNHAFYLCATKIGGYSWEKAGKIWYETLRGSRLRPNTGFRRFAALTVEQADTLFGQDSAELRAVQEAWKEVGIAIR